jgi:hypothetical protein
VAQALVPLLEGDSGGRFGRLGGLDDGAAVREGDISLRYCSNERDVIVAIESHLFIVLHQFEFLMLCKMNCREEIV